MTELEVLRIRCLQLEQENKRLRQQLGGTASFAESAGFSAETFDRDRAIRNKAKELGKDPNDVTAYAEAMMALGYTY